jgi:NAD(P)H-nitrite reductase large subunit
MQTKYLVIGINAAGFYAIEALREHDPQGSIIAVNGEQYMPYKRTKVNKHFHPAKLDVEKFQLADSLWYEKNRIMLMNNTQVTSVDILTKTANLDNGEILEWQKLLFSTGAEPNCPLSDEFEKAVSIRSFDDALQVKELIETSESCLVYGLGIEGVETAAQLNEAGLKVAIAGRGGKLLKRYFSSYIAGMIENLFKASGVTILHNTAVSSIHSVPTENTVNRENSVCVTLKDAKSTVYDFLLYSTGIKPRNELAQACGIKTEGGILINSRMETSFTDIYAAGDCAQLESGTITDHWHSAQDQGRTAAANMAGLSSAWPLKKYRLKIELFGKFYFSMRPFIEDITANLKVEESILSDRVYRLFYYEKDRLKGLEMAGDKSRAKLYEQAVNEEWDKNKVKEFLG